MFYKLLTSTYHVNDDDLYLFCSCTVIVAQSDRRALKTTPAENIYATLSEVGAVIFHGLLDGEQN